MKFIKIDRLMMIPNDCCNLFLFQIDNVLEVFVGGKLYKPILWTKDPKPIPVKYVSFASNDGSRVLVFYNCEGDKSSNVLSTKETNKLVVPTIDDEEGKIL